MNTFDKTILLFGMPRSGTTWIGKTFDSHPDTKYLHEPDSRDPKVEFPLFPQSSGYEEYSKLVDKCVTDWLTNNSVSVVGKLPLFNKSYHRFGYKAIYPYLIYASKALGRFCGELRIPDVSRAISTNSRTLVWKSIESLGRLPIISAELPKAKAIHIVRNPCGYVDSVMRGESRGSFSSMIKTADDYGFLKLLVESEVGRARNLSLNLLQRASEAERLAWRWVVMNEKAYTELNRQDNYKVVYYDSICVSPIARFQEIFRFSGLPWHKQSENFLISSNANHDENYYSVQRNPSQAANAWRSRLPKEIEAKINAIVRDSDFWKIVEAEHGEN